MKFSDPPTDEELRKRRTPDRAPRYRGHYNAVSESGKPCRSVSGHVYFREQAWLPVLRMSHKPHILAEIKKPFPRLTPRQAKRFVGRETRGRAIAAKFPAIK
jgi:hypothetical protein